MPSKPLQNSIESRIGRYVGRCGRGTVFTPATFAAVGSRAAVDKALQRLAAEGVVRRLSRGWYDKPRTDDLLGPLWPTVDSVIKALVGKERLRVQPAGLYAANLLGLSEQVPAKIVLLTDGTGRSVRIGPMQLLLKRTSPRNMTAAGRLSGLVIQALKSLGAQHITQERLALLRARLPAAERARLLDDVALAPGWMQPILRELAQTAPDAAGQAKPRRAQSGGKSKA
ncbi:MAG: DUF6088 family protein [Kiritimatiellia bacterium]|jgi:hypothetical protein|nr:DUF6088 family protein [Kiritimatiellia bacterium]